VEDVLCVHGSRRFLALRGHAVVTGVQESVAQLSVGGLVKVHAVGVVPDRRDRAAVDHFVVLNGDEIAAIDERIPEARVSDRDAIDQNLGALLDLQEIDFRIVLGSNGLSVRVDDTSPQDLGVLHSIHPDHAV
jgi:hypothetical protein